MDRKKFRGKERNGLKMIGYKKQDTKIDNQVNCLLQDIQHASLCYYLSDLHSAYTHFNAEVKESISHIPDEKYTLGEWNEAIAYITGTNCNCSSIQEAKDKINK